MITTNPVIRIVPIVLIVFIDLVTPIVSIYLPLPILIVVVVVVFVVLTYGYLCLLPARIAKVYLYMESYRYL